MCFSWINRIAWPNRQQKYNNFLNLPNFFSKKYYSPCIFFFLVSFWIIMHIVDGIFSIVFWPIPVLTPAASRSCSLRLYKAFVWRMPPAAPHQRRPSLPSSPHQRCPSLPVAPAHRPFIALPSPVHRLFIALPSHLHHTFIARTLHSHCTYSLRTAHVVRTYFYV